MFIFVSALLILLLFVCLRFAATPGQKCSRCGSRWTYTVRERLADTSQRDVLHVFEIRTCLRCKKEDFIREELRPLL